MDLQLAPPPLANLRLLAHRPKAASACTSTSTATAAPSTSCSSSTEQPLKPRPRLPRQSPAPRPRPRPNPTRLPALCAAIERHAAAGRHAEALDLFRLARAGAPFTPLPARTYQALLLAAAALREPGTAAAVAWHVESSGFELDLYTHNHVLRAYLECGMLAEARRAFDGMPDRNGVTWGIMMGGLVDRGCPRAALALFQEMRAEAAGGDAPPPRSLVVALSAATSSGSARAGRQLHCCVVKVGACGDVTDRYLACALLDMYSKCGLIDEARRVFDGLPRPHRTSVVAWNSMLAAYVLHGHSEEVLELYQEMCRSRVAMDQFTFSTMLGVFSRLGLLEHAKQAHAGLIQRGLPLDIVGNTALVDLYCKWGRMEDARNVFERMPRRNLISWNALIAGYGYHGMGDKAIEMFERLIAEGVAPNHVTFLAVLNACRFSGLVDKGKRIFQLMTENLRMKPRAMHYACVIELFAAEQLLAMEPDKINSYVVLLNLYVSSGRQDDACKVVQTLKRKGLYIHNASSWITVKKTDHRFFFKDTLHPQSAEIYRRLDTLMKDVREAGYVAEENELLPDIHPEEQKISRAYHSERLAIVFGLISTSPHTPLRITQSHRLCSDCHKVIKFVAKVTMREIVVRDGSRFHHFKLGICSCGDYW
ncbi:unnamed protein product [Miscanthus lutarioriparius]|uniref:DYW domain-containing protein n=1 Tax=Miscanthus lutarioriparius TaxID=422564 RepID=A0A811PTF9_9POAL|nr:unnamed protein product [Miscanthus lutarioriparius]